MYAYAIPYYSIPTFLYMYAKISGISFCARHLVSFFFHHSKVIIYFAFFSLPFISIKLMVFSTLFEVHKFNQLLPRILLTKRKRREKKSWREKWRYTHIYRKQSKWNEMKWIERIHYILVSFRIFYEYLMTFPYIKYTHISLNVHILFRWLNEMLNETPWKERNRM